VLRTFCAATGKPMSGKVFGVLAGDRSRAKGRLSFSLGNYSDASTGEERSKIL